MSLLQLVPEEARSSSFRITFLDREMRITRGDRGELRVYARDDLALGALPSISDPEESTTLSSLDVE
jgi:hypothetical protein